MSGSADQDRRRQPQRARPHGLVAKLLALIVSLALAAQLGSAGVIAYFGAQSARETFDNHLKAFVSARNDIVGALVWRLQYEELDRILHSMLAEPSIVSVQVYDEAGTVVGAAARDGATAESTIERKAELRYANENVQDKAGSIEVRASLDPILAERRRQLFYAILVALVSAIAIVVAIWLALRSMIVRPLAILGTAITQVRSGHQGIRVPERPLDEIGIFYRAFNAFIAANEKAVRDIEQANERLRHLVAHDDLTGLPNRRSAQSDFATRRGARDVAVHFIDLDKFKMVNDTLGHLAGDSLLCQFSQRLGGAIAGQGRAYRLSGDEFLVLQHATTSSGRAVALAEKILAETIGDYALDGHIHRLGISLGIYLAEEGLDDFDDILGLADLALADAKRSGRGRISILDREMRQALAEKVWLEREIKVAIANGGFEAYFQPQIDHASGRMVSAESLSRWRHPERGLLSPGKFMPLIEEMGLSLEHGKIMIVHCCAAAATLRQHMGETFTVSLNANARQVGSSEFWATLTQELRRHALPPSAIEIEVTESEVMENFDVAHDALANYRALGGSIALDDFGTGYSSLSYLTKLPFDTIKIDRSFVYNATENRMAAGILHLVAAFARQTGAKVIAESIEKVSEEEQIVSSGIQLLQGYLYGRPMPLADLLVHFRVSSSHAQPLPLRSGSKNG